jgi:hypothetical protein
MTALVVIVLRFLLVLLAVRLVWSLLSGPGKRDRGGDRGGRGKAARFDTSNETVAEAEYKDIT